MILKISGCFLGLRLAPIVPSFRPDVFTHPTIDERRVCIEPPRAPEIDSPANTIGKEPAIEKDESEFAHRQSGSSRDVGIDFAETILFN